MMASFNPTWLNPSIALSLWIAPWPWLSLIGQADGQSAAEIILEDRTDHSGITFVHSDGSSGKRYIVETVASGLATFDYDQDGWIDILLLNGSPLPGSDGPAQAKSSALYRNLGDGTFAEVTHQAGLIDQAYHLGVCTGDVDNDGDTDIYYSNFGENTLMLNNGRGEYVDATQSAGLTGCTGFGAGACFLDGDLDGDLDLFVANYVGFEFEKHQITHMNGYPVYVGPLNYPSTSNRYYENQGKGKFVDRSAEAGLTALKGAGMGVIAADLDRDGDPDLVVANDLRPDHLLINDGQGHFSEQGLTMGIAYDGFGQVQGSMGVECGDWNRDGWLDLLITPYHRQVPILFENQGGRYFEDVSRRTGLAEGTYADVKWGVGMPDLNNDGYLDVFIACGHLIDNVDLFDDSTRYKAPNLLLQQDRKGKFSRVGSAAGTGMAIEQSSRGAAFDDLDNDGDLDVVILNARSKPSILINETKTDHHWFQLSLVGHSSNRDGVGARVSLSAGASSQVLEKHSGRGYQSDYGKRLHFGLGHAEIVDVLEIRWPSGKVDIHRQVPVDRHLLAEEGNARLLDRTHPSLP